MTLEHHEKGGRNTEGHDTEGRPSDPYARKTREKKKKMPRSECHQGMKKNEIETQKLDSCQVMPLLLIISRLCGTE